MKNRLAEIAARRIELLEIIEIQRLEMAEISLCLEKPLQIFDAGINTFGFIKRHPKFVAGSLTAILTFFRHGIPGISFLIPPILQFTFNRLLSNSRTKEIQPDVDSTN
jgi:hypothetical protein